MDQNEPMLRVESLLSDRVCPYCNGFGYLVADKTCAALMSKMREDCGLTMDQMAEELCMSWQMVHWLESGVKRWRPTVILRWIAACASWRERKTHLLHREASPGGCEPQTPPAEPPALQGPRLPPEPLP